MKNLFKMLVFALVAFFLILPQPANAFCYESNEAKTIQNSPKAPPQYFAKKMTVLETFLAKHLLKKRGGNINKEIEQDAKTTQTLGIISAASIGFYLLFAIVSNAIASSSAGIGFSLGLGIFAGILFLAALVLGILSVIMAKRILEAREATPEQRMKAKRGKLWGLIGLIGSGILILFAIIAIALVFAFGG